MRPSSVSAIAKRVLAASVVAFVTCPLAQAEDLQESDFLSRVRRLTYDGLRAGEGYFSPDGSRMVFQSERDPSNPFYQIFELDLETGDNRRVSPGTGKTTCAFIQDGTGNVLFSSTHHDPRSLDLQKAELDFRASGQERRYSWDYDPEMEIYVAEGDSFERLTNVRGYDAEGSYSPDGRWIVYSSMRDAYGRELSVEEAQQLETDPSYFGEIYIMRADGSGQRRLTKVPGYDGGPFFTPDGESIVWRRFTENGLVADVWTMKADGSEARALTDFAAMSWAPYTHPSGDYILFASNKLGFSNFEIFMVDSAGRREPVRVTYSDGFDGLPVPTPDGKGLSWTSTRHGGDGGQIYLGTWNHEAALGVLERSPLREEASQ